jgi:hypothetical protein
MSTEHEYEQAADWAENDMTLKPRSATALRGSAAAELGRGLLSRATGGRPALDPSSCPGEHSRVRQVRVRQVRVRQVRVPADLGARLDEVARAQNRRVSEVMRDALADYISTHRAG